MNRNILFVNINKLIVWLIPEQLRQAKMIVFINVVLFPIKRLFADLRTFEKSIQYQLTHNSQVCRMQYDLNDLFDYTQRRIQVVDGDYLDEVLLWSRSEWSMLDDTERVYLWGRADNKPLQVWGRNDYNTPRNQFYIKVPSDFTALQRSQIAIYVEEYRLASKTFSIINI